MRPFIEDLSTRSEAKGRALRRMAVHIFTLLSIRVAIN